jgi:hypothetical protein
VTISTVFLDHTADFQLSKKMIEPVTRHVCKGSVVFQVKTRESVMNISADSPIARRFILFIQSL